MSHSRTIPVDSLSNVQDIIADSDIKDLDHYVSILADEAYAFGIEILEAIEDEGNDQLLLQVAYGDVQDLIDWMIESSDERGETLEHETVLQILEECPEAPAA